MLLSVLYIIGITAEAMTGALAAGRRKMDVFGVIIIALSDRHWRRLCARCLTWALSIRLGSKPRIYLDSRRCRYRYYLIAPMMKHLRRLFLILDAIGLIVFSILGAQIALDMNYSPVIAAIAAVITGVFGGVLRDMLCNTIPSFSKKKFMLASHLLLHGCILGFYIPHYHKTSSLLLPSSRD